MKGFLLDTNIVSELRRPNPDAQVEGFVAAQPEELLFFSEVGFAEIRYGIERVDNPVRRAELNSWLNHSLRPIFAGRTLVISEDVILRWRDVDHFVAAGVSVLDPWTGRFFNSGRSPRLVERLDDSDLLERLA